MDSSSNKKPTPTILDKEDDLIEEWVTVRVDTPMPQPFRDSTWQSSNRLLLEHGIYPWHAEFKWSHHVFEDLEARLTIICIIHPFPGSGALTSPSHYEWDTILGQLFTLFLIQLLHTMLLGMHPYCLITWASMFSKHFANYGIIFPIPSAQRVATYQSSNANYRWTFSRQILQRRSRSFARKLLYVGQDNKRAMTCTFLFSAFHRLCQDVNGIVQLAASKWICIWFHGHRFTLPLPNVIIGS